MLKKLGIGAYCAFATLILAVVSWIIYGVNVTSAGYFHNESVPSVVLFTIFAILCEALVIAALFLPKKEGILGKILPIVQSSLSVLAVFFLMFAAMRIIGARAQGLGYILGADSNAQAEFTAADFSSATMAIVAFIAYLVSSIAAVVTPFFGFEKKEKVAE